MKIIKHLAVLLLFVSCEKEIAVRLDKHESKLVVNSFFSPSNSIWINISRSIPVLEKDTVHYVANAGVQLYCQRQMIGCMNYLGDGNYHLRTSIEQCKVYAIVVNVPGFASVSAGNVIPDKPKILSLDTMHLDDELLYCEIEFQNDLKSDNYYILEVETGLPTPGNDSALKRQAEIINSDIIVENGDLGAKLKRLIFSGEILRDSVGELGFVLEKTKLFGSNTHSSNMVYIQFRKISEDYYLYLKSFYESKSRLDEIYTNVDNGYGIFAAYNTVVDSFEIGRLP